MKMDNADLLKALDQDTGGGQRIASRATLFKLVMNPNLYFGKGDTDGSIEIEGDLVTSLEAAYHHRLAPGTPWSRWLDRAARW